MATTTDRRQLIENARARAEQHQTSVRALDRLIAETETLIARNPIEAVIFEDQVARLSQQRRHHSDAFAAAEGERLRHRDLLEKEA